MDLSVITVSWNSVELIGKQIESVKKGCKNISCEEIIVDNCSKDGTADFVKNNFPDVKLIANSDNPGFGYANNQGVKISQGRYLLFLNPDMRVEEGSLDKIIEWMDAHPDVGLVSCKLVDENGKLNADAQPRRFPGVWDQLATIFKIPHVFPSVLNRYMFKDFDAEREQEVDSVRGSFMVMPRAVYEKLGWAFDPRYYIWFEDVDTCREIKRLGYKVVHTPIITCVDYVGQSFKKRDTLWKQRNYTKSMLQYFKKWEPWYKWVPIYLARPVGIMLAWVNDKLSK